MLRITAEGDLRELAAFWQDMTETGRVSRSWSTGPDVRLEAEWPTNGGQELPLTEYEAANAAARAAQEQAQHMAECLDIQARRIVELEERMTDHEAKQFVDNMEAELEFESWGKSCAAHVMGDLEEVERTLAAAMEAATRGEDVGHLLLKAHGDVCMIMADLAADYEDEEE